MYFLYNNTIYGNINNNVDVVHNNLIFDNDKYFFNFITTDILHHIFATLSSYKPLSQGNILFITCKTDVTQVSSSL